LGGAFGVSTQAVECLLDRDVAIQIIGPVPRLSPKSLALEQALDAADDSLTPGARDFKCLPQIDAGCQEQAGCAASCRSTTFRRVNAAASPASPLIVAAPRGNPGSTIRRLATGVDQTRSEIGRNGEKT
jgi:hypothetical protein